MADHLGVATATVIAVAIGGAIQITTIIEVVVDRRATPEDLPLRAVLVGGATVLDHLIPEVVEVVTGEDPR